MYVLRMSGTALPCCAVAQDGVHGLRGNNINVHMYFIHARVCTLRRGLGAPSPPGADLEQDAEVGAPLAAPGPVPIHADTYQYISLHASILSYL